MANRRLPVISVFSGALGFDLGLEKAGFEIRVVVECDRFATETIRRNRPGIPIIAKKIECVTTQEILDAARLKSGEAFAVVGGPSCQPFSTAGQRGSIADPRGNMFQEFLRVVREAQPEFFLMENVKGVLSAAIQHRPLKERGPGHPPLQPDEELGSAFLHILEELKKTSYYTVFDVLNTANYGVPQIRERVIFVGSRAGRHVAMPEPTHVKEPVNGEAKWVNLRDGLKGIRDLRPIYTELSENKKKYLRLVPEGGNWRDLPPGIREEAMGGAYKSWGGRGGFFRRLSWTEPAPALTTRPTSKATLLCHPTKLRPLSIGEYGKLQQFPDEWEFAGGIPQQYLQIGNAVPLGLGEAIGKAVRQAKRNSKRRHLRGTVACANDDLLKRIINRPRTFLNPPRMRKVKDIDAGKEWLNGKRNRLNILDHVSRNCGE